MELQIKDLWDKYWLWIIGGAIIVVLIVIFFIPNAEPTDSHQEKKKFEYKDRVRSGEKEDEIEKVQPDIYADVMSQYHLDGDITELMSDRSDTEPIPPPNIYKNWATKKDSIGEKLCRQALQDIYGVPFPSVRPDWLKNTTGRNLELDCYNDDLKIGLEYQGIQHYHRVKKWQTEGKYQKQREHDRIKFEKCKESGIYLIIVPHTVPHAEIREYIEYYLPQNRQDRVEQGMTE